MSAPAQPSYFLRPLEPGDAPAVAGLEREIFTAEAWSPELVAAEIASPWSIYMGAFARRVATPDNTLHGMLGDTPSGDPAPAPSVALDPAPDAMPGSASDKLIGYAGVKGDLDGDLMVVAVIPSRRGQGIGRTLVEQVLSAAHARGMECVFLEVRESNRVAQRLYATLGFEKMGVVRGYYQQPPEDAIRMGKTLAASTSSTIFPV